MAEARPDEPKKKGSSTFVMIAVFMLVLLIMFDNNLRLATGRLVGAAFDPVASVWQSQVVWTLVFASVVMILATTAIRHFLVDWVHMARTQEVMRTFQKEFAAARKSNNTYQIKRLTEVQPEIMKLQADMSTGQLKPMAFTMLLVIPIFAWLTTVTAAPIVYASAINGATEPALLLAVGADVQSALLVANGEGEFKLLHGADLHVLALPGGSLTGKLALTHPGTEDTTTLDLSQGRAVDWARYRVGELEAGAYRVKPNGDPKVGYTIGEDQHATLSHVLVAVPKGGAASDAVVAFVDGNGADLTLASASDVYLLIPVATGTFPTGGLVDVVRPVGNDLPVATWEVTVESHLFSADPDAALGHVIPHSARFPWNPGSDLNGSWWVLPKWILVYSLFSIPIGQLTQKVLKLWEYSKVDLDQDGKAPGLHPE